MKDKRGRDITKFLVAGTKTRFHLGQISPNKGKKLSQEIKDKISLSRRRENVGYFALHYRVYRERGKAKICRFCGSIKNVQWANVGGDYQKTEDYIELCSRCHHYFDNLGQKSWITRKSKAEGKLL